MNFHKRFLKVVLLICLVILLFSFLLPTSTIQTNWGQDIIYILKRTPDGAIQRLYLTPNGIEFILMDRVFCQNLL